MSQNNPYEAPRAVLEDAPSGAEELAGLGERLGAALVDTVIAFALAIPIWLIFDTWSKAMQGIEPSFSETVLSSLMGFVLFLIVHGYVLKQNGQTVGKRLLGIRIANLDNTRPEFFRLIGLRYLPVNVVILIPYVGILLALIDCLFVFRRGRRCIHDFIAGTKVLKVARR